MVVGHTRRVGGAQLVTHQTIATTLDFVRDGWRCSGSDGRCQPDSVASGAQRHVLAVVNGNGRRIDRTNGVTSETFLASLQGMGNRSRNWGHHARRSVGRYA
jgi:hypothetical protein